jgi:hypothetical protein
MPRKSVKRVDGLGDRRCCQCDRASAEIEAAADTAAAAIVARVLGT